MMSLMWILYIEWLTSHGAIECCAVLLQHVTHHALHNAWPQFYSIMNAQMKSELKIYKYYNSRSFKYFFFNFGITGGQNRPPKDWNIDFCTYMKPRPQNQCIEKFWWSSIKNKKFTILTFLGPRGPNGGPKPKCFRWYEIRAPKKVYSKIFKVLRWETNFFKFRPFRAPGGQIGAPNQNFSINMISGPQNQYTVKFWRSYIEKQKY